MATTIEIHGSSNDTNLVLASDSASIADRGTASVVPTPEISLNIIDSTFGVILNTEGKEGIKLAAKSANINISYTPDFKFSLNDLSYGDAILLPSYYLSDERIDYKYLTSSASIRLNSEGFLKWSQTTDGSHLIDQIFNLDGYHALLYGDTGLQDQLWTDFSINSVTDFSGKTMRCAGQWKDWLQLNGATRPSDYQTNPNVNILEYVSRFQDPGQPAFPKMTYNYTNFTSEPRATFYLMIKNSVWNRLSVKQKTVLESSCLTNYGSMDNIIKNVNDFYYENISTWKDDPTHYELDMPASVKTSFYTYSKTKLEEDLSNNSTSTTFSRLINSMKTFSLANPEYVIDPTFISY